MVESNITLLIVTLSFRDSFGAGFLEAASNIHVIHSTQPIRNRPGAIIFESVGNH